MAALRGLNEIALALHLYIWNIGYMNDAQAIAVLSALAQPTRLDAYRALIRSGPEGMAAGKLADRLEVPQNTLSAHLGILQRAGLVSSTRQSREIIYRPELEQVRELTLFLLKDCCGSRPELCAPLFDELTRKPRRKAGAHGC